MVMTTSACGHIKIMIALHA